MNKTMKKNIVVSAILTIMLCVSLIAGATFALFTSESKVNVAVTSGKVDVVASIEELKLYSPQTVSATTAEGYQEVDSFTNGGTASVDGNNLSLSNMSAGDKAAFKIRITNNSTISAIYRTAVSVSEDTGLFDSLKITVDEETLSMKKTEWKNVDFSDKTYSVVVELPAEATAQGVSCTLTFVVEAMQGNAVTNDILAADLATILKNPVDGVVTLEKSYDIIDDWTPVSIPVNTVIDGNGHYITGLTASLIASHNPSLTFKNLTLKDSVIHPTDEGHSGNGAFISYSSYDTEYVFNNCHLDNVTVETYSASEDPDNSSQGGGFIGHEASNVTVSISNCSVKNSTVKGNSSAGGFIGIDTGKATISNSTVSHTRLVSVDNGEWRVGAMIGTKNGTYKSTISDCSESNNTYSMPNSTATNPNHAMFGRIKGGALEIGDTVYCYSAYLQGVLSANNYTVTLDRNYVLLDNWTPMIVRVNNSVYTGTISVDGKKNATECYSISGLTNALFGYNPAVNVKISNLVIKDSAIRTGEASDVAENYACGAFVAFRDTTGAIGTIELNNCHLLNSSVTATVGHAGGLIGYVAQDNISVMNCTVKNCTITGAKSVGGIIGFSMTDANVTQTVENCMVENCSVSGEYAGQIAGTVNNQKTFTIKNCTYTGEAVKRDLADIVITND